MTYWNRATNHHVAGHFDAAIADVAFCEQIAESMGDSMLQCLASCVRARVLASRGEAAIAVDWAQRALRASQNSVATSTALRVLGDAQLEAGDVSAVVATLEGLIGTVGSAAQLTVVMARCNLADAYVIRGDTAAATSMARAFEASKDPMGAQWLLEKIERTITERFDRSLYGSVTGYDDHHNGPVGRLDSIEQLEAINSWHLDVREDQTDRRVGAKAVHGLLGRRRRAHWDVFILEDQA